MALTTRSNAFFTTQSVPPSTGGRSSKSGIPWPGTYSPRWSSKSVVFGAIRTFTPARCAVSTISSTAASSKSPSFRITSSGRVSGDALRQFPVTLGRQHVDEFVRDPGPLPREHAPERREALTAAEEERPLVRVKQPLQLQRERVVRRAEQADRDRADDERRRDQPRRVEVVARPVPESEDDRRDEQQRRGDAAETGTVLAGRVQPRLPEDEQGDRDQERQPLIGLRPPEQAPEHRVAEDHAAQDESDVEAEGQPGRVEQRERRDSEHTPSERPQRRA